MHKYLIIESMFLKTAATKQPVIVSAMMRSKYDTPLAGEITPAVSTPIIICAEESIYNNEGDPKWTTC